jgi:hypothetical protein
VAITDGFGPPVLVESGRQGNILVHFDYGGCYLATGLGVRLLRHRVFLPGRFARQVDREDKEVWYERLATMPGGYQGKLWQRIPGETVPPGAGDGREPTRSDPGAPAETRATEGVPDRGGDGGGTLVVKGRLPTYHLKQLVFETIRNLIPPGIGFVNRIEVAA